MPYYDEIVKHLMDRFPYPFAALALNTPQVEVEARLSTEQPTIKMHHSDMTFKIRLPDEEAILHIEAQTDDSTHKPMPLRMLAYAGFLALQHEMNVYSTVLYLRPTAGHRDPGFYGYGDDRRGGLWFKYTVIRLHELEGEAFLDAEAVGLLPFTPLMKPPAGITTEAWVEKCIKTTHTAAVDKQTRATLLFALSVFGSLAHPPELFQARILEEIMRESPFYERVMQRGIEQGIEQGIERGIEQGIERGIEQGIERGIEQGIERGIEQGIERGIEQGIEQGARETTIENTLVVLTTRFPNADVDTLKPTLEAIADLKRLKQLNLNALLAPSFQAFQHGLEA